MARSPEDGSTVGGEPGDPGPVLDLNAALRSVRRLVPPSPLLEVPELSAGAGVPVYLKLESLQVTGSFKVRGAAACILALDAAARKRGVVTCSSGNHGRAVAWVAGRLGVPAVVCVPAWVDPVKLDAIRAAGAETLVEGETYDEAAGRAREIARARGLSLVHPFDDIRVAAGQGTVALEILDELPDVGTVVVPLSGGGLAGGMAWALRRRGRGVRTVAVSAERAGVMVESLRAGRPVEAPEEPTLASALSGGIELDNRVTFRLVRDEVDEHVLVSETAIGGAMAHALMRRKLVVEGGGAVALAAVLEGRVNPAGGRPLVVVISGGNVSPDVLVPLLDETPEDPRGALPGPAAGRD